MRYCADHWDMCLEAIKRYGLESLVSSEDMQLVGRGAKMDPTVAFNPLLALHDHFLDDCIKHGGDYIMRPDFSGNNNGHYCPVCEFAKHSKRFVPLTDIDRVAGQVAAFCRKQGLVTTQ